MSEICKTYKPEILSCPFCGTKLIYRHTVSSKSVYFSNGKKFRIKNLGYGCPSCLDHRIYVSQTANKICFKGLTYSSKVVCMIAYYKQKHWGRDAICDLFSSKGIEISYRNIDLLYQKFLSHTLADPIPTIQAAMDRMLEEYKQIRLAIDVITIEECVFLLVYDFFSSKLLVIRSFHTIRDPKIEEFIASFLNPLLPIGVIASIRKDAVFIPMLKKYCPKNTKFISFLKF